MEQSSSNQDEVRICHQYDYLACLVMKEEKMNYLKHREYLRKHEVMFSELEEVIENLLFHSDYYAVEDDQFPVLGYDIRVKNSLLAEALRELTERKRDVILMSYFMNMNDEEIAKKLYVLRCTVREHRVRSLEIMRKKMEETKENETKK